MGYRSVCVGGMDRNRADCLGGQLGLSQGTMAMRRKNVRSNDDCDDVYVCMYVYVVRRITLITSLGSIGRILTGGVVLRTMDKEIASYSDAARLLFLEMHNLHMEIVRAHVYPFCFSFIGHSRTCVPFRSSSLSLCM